MKTYHIFLVIYVILFLVLACMVINLIPSTFAIFLFLCALKTVFFFFALIESNKF